MSEGINEEKVIDRVMMIERWKVSGDVYTQDELNAIGSLLDLYQKEKERNTKLITQNSIRQYNDNEKIKQLKSEVGTMKEQLQMFIPRRRVRRVYKMLGKILEKTDYGLEENKNEM